MTIFSQMVILRYQLNGKMLSREIKKMNRKKRAITCEEFILKAGDFILIQRRNLSSTLDLNIP